MYYLFISKDKYITAYIGKKINKDIAKYIIKFANINGSYQIKDCRGLINLNLLFHIYLTSMTSKYL